MSLKNSICLFFIMLILNTNCTSDYSEILIQKRIPIYPNAKVTVAKVRVELINGVICYATIGTGWGKYDSTRPLNAFFINTTSSIDSVKKFYHQHYPNFKAIKDTLSFFFGGDYGLGISDTKLFPNRTLIILKETGKLYPEITLKDGSSSYRLVTRYN